MPRRVLIQRGDDQFEVVERPAPNEHSLQEVMKANPQLVPADDLGLDGDLLVVARETTLASGAIDLLCLARSGDLVLIEFKTGPQNPDFRHALAQVIDYGSDLWRMSVEEFDRGVVQRFLNSPHVDAAFRDAKDLSEAVDRMDWAFSDGDRGAMMSRLNDVLTHGAFTYVVAAQRFTATMENSVDYLNTTMRTGRFFLLEIVRLEGQDLTAHAAQVVASPSAQATSRSSASATNDSPFTERIADPAFREVMEDLLASGQSLGLVSEFGGSGGSFRLRTPDRNEPLSVAWGFRDGGQWYGARHLTLGVDMSSLAKTPSVHEAVMSYVEAVARIPGAVPTRSELNAYIFDPASAVAAKDQIVDVIETLVEAVQALGTT